MPRPLRREHAQGHEALATGAVLRVRPCPVLEKHAALGIVHVLHIADTQRVDLDRPPEYPRQLHPCPPRLAARVLQLDVVAIDVLTDVVAVLRAEEPRTVEAIAPRQRTPAPPPPLAREVTALQTEPYRFLPAFLIAAPRAVQQAVAQTLERRIQRERVRQRHAQRAVVDLIDIAGQRLRAPPQRSPRHVT